MERVQAVAGVTPARWHGRPVLRKRALLTPDAEASGEILRFAQNDRNKDPGSLGSADSARDDTKEQGAGACWFPA